MKKRAVKSIIYFMVAIFLLAIPTNVGAAVTNLETHFDDTNYKNTFIKFKTGSDNYSDVIEIEFKAKGDMTGSIPTQTNVIRPQHLKLYDENSGKDIKIKGVESSFDSGSNPPARILLQIDAGEINQNTTYAIKNESALVNLGLSVVMTSIENEELSVTFNKRASEGGGSGNAGGAEDRDKEDDATVDESVNTDLEVIKFTGLNSEKVTAQIDQVKRVITFVTEDKDTPGVSMSIPDSIFRNINNVDELVVSVPVGEIHIPINAIEEKERNIRIEIQKAPSTVIEEVQKTNNNLQVVSEPVKIKVKGLKSDSYLTYKIPVQGQETKYSTGVLYEDTGNIRHIPTRFVKDNGRTYALLKRKGNSTYFIVNDEKEFNDTANHWAEEEIKLLASKRIINGMTEATFAPQEQVTRAQFATMLVNALALEWGGTKTNFVDVEESAWYANAVATAVEAGLVRGYEDNTFRPNAPIVRQEMAVMITNALMVADKSISLKDDEFSHKIKHFNDQEQISNWARKSVAIAVDEGIISGMPNGEFAPSAKADRAQSVVMIRRSLQALNFID
ncbi:hypothetical protein GGQ84_000865 [Desulfitispora alkaliphila]|uniref:S-layer homology domain-containing protein n=1 Tax=Desulfitispora alkaliphila TaxID=622674 RepID=UPI003D1C0B82